jgi:hypothetical protein
MTQQVTALIKFKHCDFGDEMAKAAAAYDSDESTAWIAPFTIAQKEYWARQPVIDIPNWLMLSIIGYGLTFDSLSGHAFNQYADDLATQRNTAIADKALSAYTECVAGGASAAVATPAEPGFKLVIQTQLDGDTERDSTPQLGLSAQLSIPFAPANQANADNPLPWEPFYRVGTVSWSVNSPANWAMSLPDYPGSQSAGGQRVYTYSNESPWNPLNLWLIVQIPWLTRLSAVFEQYIDVPEGYVMSELGGSPRLTIGSLYVNAEMGSSSILVQPFYLGGLDYLVGMPLRIAHTTVSTTVEDTVIITGVQQNSSDFLSVVLLTFAGDALTHSYLANETSIGVASEVWADFTPEVSGFDFQVVRHVFMPDGAHITDAVSYADGVMVGEFSSIPIYTYFPALTQGCEVSGMVDIYYVIHAYTAQTIYELNSNVERVVRADGVICKKRFAVGAYLNSNLDSLSGGLNSVYESFYYLYIRFGIIRVKYFDYLGAFKYEDRFLVWVSPPFDLALYPVESATMNSSSHSPYETNATAFLIFLNWVDQAVNPGHAHTMHHVPVIEDVEVHQEVGAVTLVGSSAYVSYVDNVIKIRDFLKTGYISTPYTPVGVFSDPNVNYQPVGGLLTTLPDLITHIQFNLKAIRIDVYDSAGVYGDSRLFMLWDGAAFTTIDTSGYSVGLSLHEGTVVKAHYNSNTYVSDSGVPAIGGDSYIPTAEHVAVKTRAYPYSGYDLLSGGPTSHVYIEEITDKSNRLVVTGTLANGISGSLNLFDANPDVYYQ